ncbi:hypothetical protein ANN_13909 [Periplaneta americana]|uniref:Uncharacterized protein n=1 Tax=Periplaneta americana TaxID=6978 RepID=A0ABQ8SWZ6_PERAM|nr:hypothetical protein ANN_13909 [Periplaneta americana]
MRYEANNMADVVDAEILYIVLQYNGELICCNNSRNNHFEHRNKDLKLKRHFVHLDISSNKLRPYRLSSMSCDLFTFLSLHYRTRKTYTVTFNYMTRCDCAVLETSLRFDAMIWCTTKRFIRYDECVLYRHTDHLEKRYDKTCDNGHSSHSKFPA